MDMPCALANERISAFWHFPDHSIICCSKTELTPRNSEKLYGDTSKRRQGRKKDASHASNSVLLEVLQSTRIRWHAKQSTS